MPTMRERVRKFLAKMDRDMAEIEKQKPGPVEISIMHTLNALAFEMVKRGVCFTEGQWRVICSTETMYRLRKELKARNHPGADGPIFFNSEIGKLFEVEEEPMTENVFILLDKAGHTKTAGAARRPEELLCQSK